MWTRIPYSARIGLPVHQYVGEAARKPILPLRKTRTEKTGKNHTERYGIPNFRRFRKNSATSIPRITWIKVPLWWLCGEALGHPSLVDFTKHKAKASGNSSGRLVGPLVCSLILDPSRDARDPTPRTRPLSPPQVQTLRRCRLVDSWLFLTNKPTLSAPSHKLYVES